MQSFFVICFLAKLCSMVSVFFSGLAPLQYALLWCVFNACSTNENGSISFISSTRQPTTLSDALFACLLANTYTHACKRWLSFEEVFQYFHHAVWKWVAVVFAYMCMHFLWMALRLNRLHVISMGFEAFAHGHFYNSFFSLSLSLSCALFFPSYYWFSLFVLGATQLKDIFLLFNFTIWNIYIVQVKKCQHES